MSELAADCDQVVAAAAMIGGISYFHEFAYDLLAENERILAADVRRRDRGAPGRPPRADHRRVSSSMVYESATVFPTPEGAQLTSPPPISTYGFQKLASEYFAQGRLGAVPAAVHDRPAVQLRRDRRAAGAPRHRHHVGQREARPVARRPGPRPEGPEGPGPAPHPRRRLAGPPLHVRRRPRPRDPPRDGVARRRVNDDFNLSTARSTTVLELAECIWSKIHGDGRPFRYVSDPPFEHDVQLRVPDVAEGEARSSATRRRRRSRRCSTRSSPGSATRSRRAACSVERAVDEDGRGHEDEDEQEQLAVGEHLELNNEHRARDKPEGDEVSTWPSSPRGRARRRE